MSWDSSNWTRWCLHIKRFTLLWFICWLITHMLYQMSLISCILDPLAFSYLDFTGLGRQLSTLSEVKMYSVVFVSTLLPSSFSHGRIVSILCLETGCRPATGFSLPCGKVSWTPPNHVSFWQPWVNQPQLSRLCSVFRPIRQIMGRFSCFFKLHFCACCFFHSLNSSCLMTHPLLSAKKRFNLHSNAAVIIF